MATYSDFVRDEGYGRPIPGATVKLFSPDGTTEVAMTTTGADGGFTLSAPDGKYLLDVSFGGASARSSVIVGNPPEYVGSTGPANSTYATLTAFRAADITNVSANYDGSLWFFETGNAPYIEDKNTVAANGTPLTIGAWKRQTGYAVQAETFGLSPSASPADNAAALWRAIIALRRTPTTLSTDGLGSGPFDAYASGQLLIGEGVFRVAAGSLKIFQDLGLVIKGQGSRKTNNSVIGRTVLLFSGAGQFGIQLYANGARGFVAEDIDLNYEAPFSGDVLDNFGSPGMVTNRCHLGTHGISGGTRLQTARALIRSSYGEFIHCLDTTFDGAIDGIWFDEQRQSSVGPTNEFGGSGMLFTSCVIYDITGSMVRADGERNLKKLAMRDCAFNPISVNCTHALKLNNVDALAIEGCLFSPSVSNIPTGGWLNIVNCTGSITENEFLGACNLTAAAGIDGHLTVSNNFIDADQGFVLRGGIFIGSGNEFSRCASGWKTAAAIIRPLALRLGPDIFKSTDVGYSYDIETDSTLLDGVVDYVAALDSSATRFRNVSGRVVIQSGNGKRIDIASTPYTVLATDTGARISMSAANAVANLPAVTVAGLKFTFFTNGTNTFTVNAPTSTLFVGGGGAKTSVSFTGDAGSMVTVENFAGAWNITNLRGGATFT